MICDPAGAEPLKGALLAATLEVGQPHDGRGRSRDLYISGSDDITDSVIVGDMAALGTRYTIRRPYINSVAGRDVPPTPWQGTQVWLLTKHGLVGLLEVEATEELTVPHLGAEVRLGPGTPIEQTANGSYCVGPLVTRILDTNFSEMTVGKARPPYAQSESKHEAILLRTGGDEHTARPGEPLYCAVLAAPQDAAKIKGFRRLDTKGLWAFQVTIDGKPVVVSFNPADKALRLEPL
jgi:hypothetical protein